MPPLKDLTGHEFGRLTVVTRYSENDRMNKPKWVCKCGCGTVVVVAGACLVSGNSKSCGCFKRDNPSRLRHGMVDTKEYDVWTKMRARCDNASDKSYKRYGGRGIKYDPRWSLFDNFIADMGMRPGPRFTLERINNDLGYSKENCRWATFQDQARNKSTNRLVTIEGVTKCLAAWADTSPVVQQVIRARLRDKWTPKAAVCAPMGTKRKDALRMWPEGV